MPQLRAVIYPGVTSLGRSQTVSGV